MPARPPLMKGSEARIMGVWRMLEVACLGFSAADFMAAEASVRTVSEVCFADSRARLAGIFMEGAAAAAAVDMVVGSELPTFAV